MDSTTYSSIANIRKWCCHLYYNDSIQDAEVANRILQRASSHLMIPGQTFVAACGLTLSLSCLEGYIHLKHKVPTTFAEFNFIVRYGMANLIPSFISGRIKAETILIAKGINPNIIIPKDMTDKRFVKMTWRRKRLQSHRGALATTMLLTQLLSMVQVSSKAQDDFAEQIRMGREPPLLENTEQQQVVVRLTGESSDVTGLGMLREGSKKYFPIYEQSNKLGVKKLVRMYGLNVGRFGIPVYWQVDDGHYGHKESWQGMAIPSRWLFDKKKKPKTKENNEKHDHSDDCGHDGDGDNNNNNHSKDKVLILEADATGDEGKGDRTAKQPVSWILDKPKENRDWGLSLYEITQGFYRLSRLVEPGAPPFDVVRVLLADASAIVNRGAGRRFTIKEFVADMGMADVIVDIRDPLVLMMLRWLDEKYTELRERQHKRRNTGVWAKLKSCFTFRQKIKKKPVILMTPDASSYQWISATLNKSGYRVLDLKGATETYGDGESIEDIPVIVYEPTTLDTVHTVERLVYECPTCTSHKKEMICALCPTHRGLVRLKPGETSEVFSICGSDMYDYLLRVVRNMIREGHEPEYIQKQLDENLDTLLAPETFLERDTLGFPPL